MTGSESTYNEVMVERGAHMERQWKGGLVGPTILICLGLIILLGNLGVIGWSVWDVLFRIWPVLLIAIGLDLIIGRRSLPGSVAVVVVTLAIVGAAIWFLPARHERPFRGEFLTSETISQPLGEAESAEIELRAGVAELRLGTAQDKTLLVEGSLDLRNRERVVRDYELKDKKAYYTLRSRGWRAFGPWGRWGAGDWDLRLNPEIPMILRVDTGVGESALDLSGLNLTELRINTGVGRTRVTLPGQGRYSAEINGGVGEIEVTIPMGMGYRIRIKKGIADVNLPDDLERQGDLYLSPGYEQAENRVDLEVRGGIGEIDVNQEDSGWE